MQKWEYTTRAVQRWRSFDEIYGKLGADSWELVAVSNGIAYFKRPMPEETIGDPCAGCRHAEIGKDLDLLGLRVVNGEWQLRGQSIVLKATVNVP